MGNTFYVLQTRAGTRLRSRIDFDEIGAGCRIVCESGVGSVPLLIGIVNLVALANDAACARTSISESCHPLPT